MSDQHSDLPEMPAYHCPQCDGDMTYHAGRQAMECHHCGHIKGIPKSEGYRAVVEYDLERGLAESHERGYGTEVRTTQCQECGASVSFGTGLTATECDFCGSPQVLHQDQNRRLLRPGALVPFRVPREEAKKTFATWIGKLWFRPSDLARKARLSDMSGVYVPYWTFNAKVRSDWLAMAGYHYYETERYTEEDEQGNKVKKTRKIQRTRWRPAWGARTDLFQDVLICASRGLPKKLERKLRTFKTSALLPYDPSYLAGWKAEEYAVELNDGWREAVQSMEATQKRRCSSEVPGDTHRALYVTSTFSGQTFKHILLPIWISSYRYGDRVYRFLINGQSGKITGKAPLSPIKITLFVASIAALVTAAIIWWQLYR